MSTTHPSPFEHVRDALLAALGPLPPGPLLVGFSGGLDSTVLLHTLAALAPARVRGLRAIHVDHRLQPESADWTRHCRQFCEKLEIDCDVVQVDVGRADALGPEGLARRARYNAFKQALRDGEVLALAHHRGDQAETVLLKLLRGAGPEGLGAMRPLRSFGNGLIWRPLLGTPRALLHACAESAHLDWVEDPTNRDTTFDRNFIRYDVLPRLTQRWSAAEASLAQSADWSRHASEYIDAQVAEVLTQLQGLDPGTLDFRGWLGLPEALRDPVLRNWLRGVGLPTPTQYQVAELTRQLSETDDDRQPCVSWPGAEVRRYRDLLYALAPLTPVPGGWQTMFTGMPVDLPGGIGVFALAPRHPDARQPRLAEPLLLGFRRGGETLRPSGEPHVRELRDLFQSAGIPPWQRGRLPLLIDRNGLVLAVADLWQSDNGAALLAAANARIDWRPAATTH